MTHPPRLATASAALVALLLAGAALAAPLTLPGGATPIGARADSPARHDLAIAAFDGTSVPVQVVQGALDQQAWRVDGVTGNTMSLLQPLTDQLTAQGYRVLFTCATTQCGGFDFRFRIDVLPEPQMHVDLGDFHYLAAIHPDGSAVSLLVSRALDQGFVQITSMTPLAKTAAPPPPTLPTPKLQPQPQAAAPPADFADQLLTAGSVPLDDLVFASGKAALAGQDYASLTALADWLKINPTLRVTLVGHTDATGPLAANIALSKQRATAVRASLIAQYAADPAQIDAQGAGYLAPRTTNQTPEGRTKNRRVEVMLTPTPAR